MNEVQPKNLHFINVLTDTQKPRNTWRITRTRTKSPGFNSDETEKNQYNYNHHYGLLGKYPYTLKVVFVGRAEQRHLGTSGCSGLHGHINI